MPTLVAREYTWNETEAGETFVERAIASGADPDTMRAIARLAEDTDEAVALWEFITDYRRVGGR
jgi:hypothetical protein